MAAMAVLPVSPFRVQRLKEQNRLMPFQNTAGRRVQRIQARAAGRLDVQAVRQGASRGRSPSLPCIISACSSRSSRLIHPPLLGPSRSIPQLSGDATSQTPPDLPSYLFKERIVYLGMPLMPQVTELMLAELLYLQYESVTAPVFMYINSTGVAKGAGKLGYEAEAFAIYDTMCYIKPPVATIAIGNAFGEAAMLLAAGEPGRRAALPSASIMIRQPIQRFQQMQATDIDIYRTELRKTNAEVVRLLAKHTGHSEEQTASNIKRPRYMTPYEAVEYNLIDQVLEPNDEEFKQVVRAARGG
ncbi:ATP-dependent Clp protease proteolytic subunit-related protein 4, chloroplastic [Auxenochlorella protothecoides]|uniref:ATP-dependent Clp protease proteolytic subunit n=1 Tax=Auxenochlorella protothecoides TaxID=3075 RepID=A0A087SU68_AUXPR|nr:ATP-dependent Clp protease proteolytic subunit-related protein 4, chloroplastic [Auxenochlorella protothecoides]KFM29272.1 ATP-dependent Clp protease proteolytic subunit-related protein 4, chloroplastic [Auxenochlorella protothecoides]